MPMTIDDLTTRQRNYLRHLHRVSLGIRPSHGQQPSPKSLSVMLDMRIIEADDLNKPFMGMPRPLHLATYKITPKGAALIEEAGGRPCPWE